MINKIGFPKPVTPSRVETKKRLSGVSGSSFSSLLDGIDEAESVSTPESVTTAAPLTGAGMFLGLQEIPEEEIERKRAVKKGKSMIEALEQLRDSMLMGTLSPSTIRQLESVLAEKRATVTDPRLTSILDDIEVRAAVELAKLEQAGALPPKDA